MEYTLKSTDEFKSWLSNVDRADRNRLYSRLDRVANGNFGDHKRIDKELFELRCFFGGGIRVYFTVRNKQVILLLAGGNKTTQPGDIDRAKALLSDYIATLAAEQGEIT